MTLETGVKELAEAVGADVKALANGKVDSSDPRLTDSREWSAATVTQVEAEAGTASTRRAWTAQRVRQAINAWWQLVTSGFGRNLIAASNEQAARNVLQLTYPATAPTVGDGAEVMRAGAYGLGEQFIAGRAATNLGWNAPFGMNVVAVNSSGPFMSYLGISQNTAQIINDDGSNLILNAELFHTNNQLTIGKTPESARAALQLGTAATYNVGTSAGSVMRVGAGGWLGSGELLSVEPPFTGITTRVMRINVEHQGIPAAACTFHAQAANSWFRLHADPSAAAGSVWVQGGNDSSGLSWTTELYHTRNTTKNPDGTLKASSPVVNLYTDKHDLHNESQFGATPTVVRKSKGVYEITGTLGLRSDGWYLDTPNDRNGNKYFNIEWTQNITPTTVDGIVDEYREDIVVTIETFERVWNKETGMFDNGAPIDINELQDRFVQLRFNEIKVEHEDLDDETITRNQE